MFIGSGQNSNPGFLAILEHTIIGPAADFLTFIGSMGNIPLASILYSNGVSFAGVMAFIFSDLVVFPVIRLNAKYYGWKLALYILGVFLAALIATAIILHYGGFAVFGLLPQTSGGQSVAQTQRFAINYTFWLNLVFLVITGILTWLRFGGDKEQQHQHHHHHGGDKGIVERVLFYLAILSYIWLAIWLAGGLIVSLIR